MRTPLTSPLLYVGLMAFGESTLIINLQTDRWKRHWSNMCIMSWLCSNIYRITWLWLASGVIQIFMHHECLIYNFLSQVLSSIAVLVSCVVSLFSQNEIIQTQCCINLTVGMWRSLHPTVLYMMTVHDLFLWFCFQPAYVQQYRREWTSSDLPII